MSHSDTDSAIRTRRALSTDLERIETIYSEARRYMRARGNFAQWSELYPSAQTAIADMRCGWCHVIEADGRVVATFCLMTEPEPTYAALDEALTVPYVTLHRVASDGTVPGILAEAVSYTRRLHDCDIRIDTHADNAPMLTAIRRLGFSPTGPITLADGSPRLSFRLRHGMDII